MGYTPHVLVIGGGAVGTATARDLAMRGLEVTLVERDHLGAGATGSAHGLLDSGARDAAESPERAARIYEERQTLGTIAGHCVDSPGGLLVDLADADADRLETVRAGCETAGIPTDLVDGDEARSRESTLSEDVARALSVPDGVVAGARLCRANALSAAQHGATIRTNAAVIALIREHGAVSGVRVKDVSLGAAAPPANVETVDADYVVNATGAEVATIAGKVGIELPLDYRAGATLAVDLPDQDTVVRRVRPSADGDTAVPYGAASLLGTTVGEVDNPANYDREEATVDRLLDELAGVLPAVAEARPLRARWAVTPQLPTDATVAGLDGSDGGIGTVIDHEARDDTWGIATVMGGSVTTARLVGERVTDHVCGAFGIERPCRTDEVALPRIGDETPADVGQLVDANRRPDARPGAAPADPQQQAPGQILCDCERITREDLRAVTGDDPVDLGSDLRTLRSVTGAATGACCGGRCVHRLANWLYPGKPVEDVESAQDDLFETCWDDQRHALWGDGLAEAASTYALHRMTMNWGRSADEDPAWDRFDAGPDDGISHAGGSDGGISHAGGSDDGMADDGGSSDA